MADSRRSSRAKKEVDYSTFGGGDDSDDGDFTEPTPPPAKNPKEDKKKTKKKKRSRDIDDDYDEFKETSRGKRKDRKPVEDRMFDRELELALEMSKQDSSQESNDEIGSAPKRKAKEVSAIVHSAPSQITDDQENEIPMPVLCNEETHSRTSPAKHSIVNQSPVKKSPPRMPKVKKSPAKKIPPSTKRTPTASSAPAKRTPSIGRGGLVKRSVPTSKPLVSTTPKAKSNESLASPRTVALKRPAPSPSSGSANNPLGGVKLVSPGVPIRLGLSKFARVKPLHGNVKV